MELIVQTIEALTWKQWLFMVVVCMPTAYMWRKLFREIDQVDKGMVETARLLREGIAEHKQAMADIKKAQQAVREACRSPWN